MSIIIKKELTSLSSENFWQGGLSRWETIEKAGLAEEFQEMLEEMLQGESISDDGLNNFLWFECDEWLEEKGLF